MSSGIDKPVSMSPQQCEGTVSPVEGEHGDLAGQCAFELVHSRWPYIAPGEGFIPRGAKLSEYLSLARDNLGVA